MENSYSARDIALIKTACSTAEELAKRGVPHNQILDQIAIRLNYKSFRHLSTKSKDEMPLHKTGPNEHTDFSLVFDCTEWPIYPGPLTTINVDGGLMRWLETNKKKDGRDVTSRPLHTIELENTDGWLQKRLRIYNGDCFAVFELLSKDGKVTQELFGQKGVPIPSLMALSRGTLTLKGLFELRLIPKGNSVQEMNKSRTFLLSGEDGPDWVNDGNWYPFCEESQFSTDIFIAHKRDAVACHMSLLWMTANSLVDQKETGRITREEKVKELVRYGLDHQSKYALMVLDAFIKQVKAEF